MQLLRLLIAVLTSLCTTAVSVTPTLSNVALFAVPLLPIAAISYWTLHIEPIPVAVIAFACGLIVDATTGGQMGYWALLYLVSHMVTALLANKTPKSFVLTWLAFAVCLLTVSCLAWILASLLTGWFSQSATVFQPVLWVLLVYPILHLILFAITPGTRRADNYP